MHCFAMPVVRISPHFTFSRIRAGHVLVTPVSHLMCCGKYMNRKTAGKTKVIKNKAKK